MGSSILSEGCKHLDSQDGALQCYYYPLNRLPASRLLLPRSGLERSDFVPWPFVTFCSAARFGRERGIPEIDRQPSIEGGGAFDPSATWLLARATCNRRPTYFDCGKGLADVFCRAMT